jgi:hypothetical protein
MNQVTTQEPKGGLSYKNIGIAQAGGGGMLLPQTFGEVVAFATMMSRSQHAIPKHLRENDGACMAVTMQALRWEMDPFAVAAKSYNVKDLIAYEAQLVAAVVNTRAPIAKRPVYRYEGSGDTRKCIVSCEMLDGSTKEYESPEIGKITTKNSPLWKADPDQQLGYFSIRSWARRHTPEVILGVYTPEEAEQFRGPDNARDVTPRPTLMERLNAQQNAAQQPAGESEGFDASFTRDEPHDALTGEILTNTQSDDAASPPGTSDADDVPPQSSAREEAGDPPSEPASSTLFPTDRADLIECCRKMMAIPVDGSLNPQTKLGVLEAGKEDWKGRLPKELHDHIRGFFESAKAQIKADPKVFPNLREKALTQFAEWLDCTVEELGG